MSTFNKIYEYECHLFGQVSEHRHYYVWSHAALCVSSRLHHPPECDRYHDISLRPPPGAGVQIPVPEMVNENFPLDIHL